MFRKNRRIPTIASMMVLAIVTSLGAGLISDVPAVRAEGAHRLRIFNLSGGWIRGSVALGDLDGDGADDIVVGGTDGIVHAYSVAEESELWSYDTGNAAIEGKAAIGDLDGDGCKEVIIGVGSTFTPRAPGGLWAFDCNGRHLWYRKSGDFDRDGVPDGVYSTPTLADVDGNDEGDLEIIYGSWDGYIRVLDHTGTLVWERFVRDTIWSSPAIGDIDQDGRPEIVIGVDSHREPAFATEDGGMLYVLNSEDGSVLPGFPKQIDEVIWSSPALADLNSDGWLDIVVGTGYCYENPACASGGRTHPVTDALYGWDHMGNPLPGWPVSLSDYAFASPALGDLDGDADLELIINTNDGYIQAFHGDGSVVSGWPARVTTPAGPGSVVHFPTWASPILADLTGDGNLEVILPSNWEIVMLDGKGHQLTRNRFPPASGQWTLDTEYTVHGTPAIGDVDGDGRIELVAPGARAGGHKGALYVWDFDDVPADGSTHWPCFRRDDMNHARYVPPKLAVSHTSVRLVHEYGTGSVQFANLWLINEGEGEITWQADGFPAEVTIAPLSGIVGPTGQVVDLTVQVSDYQTGTYSLGSIVITGRAEGEIVINNPVTVSITLYVGAVHRTFIPLVARQSP